MRGCGRHAFNRRLRWKSGQSLENGRERGYTGYSPDENKTEERETMEIGNQIKALRLARGVTQETLAEKLGVSAQAVSKWERGATAPDVQLLPELSAYFGVTIDALFALSDETRMERIQNMIWDERFITPAVLEREEAFLLEKARREPSNGQPFELLADLENHTARAHRARAAEFAKEALTRQPDLHNAHQELVQAMGGTPADWCSNNAYRLIDWYKEFVKVNPSLRRGYLWLLDQLINTGRLKEAGEYLARMEKVDGTFRTPLYRGYIAKAAGDQQGAIEIWEQMCRDYPDEWGVHLSMGDIMARMGRYEEAKASYRRALELQEPPRYTDGLTSMAIVCEIQGDIPGAIAALEEEIALLAAEWDTTSGETVEERRREILRLKAKK